MLTFSQFKTKASYWLSFPKLIQMYNSLHGDCWICTVVFDDGSNCRFYFDRRVFPVISPSVASMLITPVKEHQYKCELNLFKQFLSDCNNRQLETFNKMVFDNYRLLKTDWLL